MVFDPLSFTGASRLSSRATRYKEHPMPNRYVTLATDSNAAHDNHPFGRILCPHCMCANTIEAEGGCSTEACDDCGSPSESE